MNWRNSRNSRNRWNRHVRLYKPGNRIYRYSDTQREAITLFHSAHRQPTPTGLGHITRLREQHSTRQSGIYVCKTCADQLDYAPFFYTSPEARDHRRQHNHRDCWLKRPQRPKHWDDPVFEKPLRYGGDGRVDLGDE
jgi:hypothetical protein